MAVISPPSSSEVALPCEFCCMQTAVVYCAADSARLCLSCDALVHSANALAHRHPRSVLCERCFSRPAAFHCCIPRDSYSIVRVTLCNACDRLVDDGNQRVPLGCYSGCPSPNEIVRICLLVNIGDVVVEESSSGEVVGCDNDQMSQQQWKIFMDSSMSMAPQNYDGTMRRVGDQIRFSSSLHMMSSGHSSASEIYHIPELHKCVLDSSSTVKALMQNHSIYPCQNTAMNLVHKEITPIADSNGSIENRQQLQAASAMGAIGAMQAVKGNTDMLGSNFFVNRITSAFPSSNNVTASFSNHAGESSTADYQDESQDSNIETNYPEARNKARMRLNEKKKRFGKCVRQNSGKAKADGRKRLKITENDTGLNSEKQLIS